MILATVNTGSYEWTAIANNQAEATVLLLEAYARHVEQSDGFAFSDVMRNYILDGSVNFHEITTGVVLRDGSPI